MSSTGHWDRAYAAGDAALSWNEAEPRQSLPYIRSVRGDPSAPVVDIGGGSSRLAGALVADGYTDVTVVDLSRTGLELARARLGDRHDEISWVAEDIPTWRPARRYAIWHDRAELHFLTEPEDRERYVATLRHALSRTRTRSSPRSLPTAPSAAQACQSSAAPPVTSSTCSAASSRPFALIARSIKRPADPLRPSRGSSLTASRSRMRDRDSAFRAPPQLPIRGRLVGRSASLTQTTPSAASETWLADRALRTSWQGTTEAGSRSPAGSPRGVCARKTWSSVRSRGLRAAAAGAVALLMGCGGGSSGAGSAAVPAARAPSGVRVPRVLGQSESRAQCVLVAAGLRWRYRGDGHVHRRPIISCSGGVTPDPKVVSQSPVAGTRLPLRGVVVLDDECLRLVRSHRGGCA